MKLIVSGLGRMGMQICRKLAEDNHTVIAHNRSFDKARATADFGATPAATKEEAIGHFSSGEPVIIWVMIPAAVTAAELASWCDVAPAGSIVIDGGNSDYRQTRRNAEIIAARGHHLIDSGTSGGIMGLKEGFCMMIGGDRTSFETVEPIFQTLAQPHGGYHYFGETGSGHYVKMVHNAIEYGIMESLAEGYRMLREGAYPNINLAAAGELWQQGSIINSSLNRLTTEALRENPMLNGIEGAVAESGEARWTLETARELNIPMPSIQAAFDVRLGSQQGEVNFATRLLAAMRGKFGGHALNISPGDGTSPSSKELRQ